MEGDGWERFRQFSTKLHLKNVAVDANEKELRQPVHLADRVSTKTSKESQEADISQSEVSETSCHKFNRWNFFKVRLRWP
ncbi:hypothetical protein HA466_0101420 [Hirschfeldia incana]|nr:hypothetical protein HA466_0101420 [Hirschfeldia incana]